MQDTSKRLNTRMVTTGKEFLSCARKPTFKSFIVYDRHLASVDMRPTVVRLNSPIAAGVVVLEVSKLKMLTTWYGLLKKIYDTNIHLLLTDTDSFLVQITGCESAFETMRKNRIHFDMSNLPPPYKVDASAISTVGKLKDELGGKDVILGFVGLRSKCYSLKLLKQEEKKAKGIPRSVMKSIQFEDYYNALFHPSEARSHDYQSIRSINQTVFTLTEKRKGLCNFEDKRILCANKIDTFPYFYNPSAPKYGERQESSPVVSSNGGELRGLSDDNSTTIMSSSKSSASVDSSPFVTVKVSDRLWVNVTEFKEEIWFHLNTKKSKSISLTTKDMVKLFKHKRDFLEASKKVQHSSKKQRSTASKSKKKIKKKKPRHDRDSEMISSGSGEYSSAVENESESEDE